MKLRRALLGSVTALASFLVIAPAFGAGTCIDDKARDALACAGGTKTVLASSLRSGPALHSIASPSRTKVAPRPPVPTLDLERDDRTIRLAARKKGLLVVEVEKLESLFSLTKPHMPDRFQIVRRLADGYVELESSALRDKTEAEIRRDALKKTAPTKAGREQKIVDDSEHVVKASRKRAVELYTLLANDYPTHPKVDEILYYLAYEYEQASDLKNARSVYYDLIKKAPGSHYIPNAYLAFGELFWSEAQGDPAKWDLAAQAYAEVIKYPAPRNKVRGYALYKLAYVHWNKGELDKALDAFKKTMEFGVANPTLPGATKLAESARRDVIPVYALTGDPTMAYAFLKGMSGDPAGANEKTYRMMDDLGTAYLDTGHYPDAITVYKDLVSRDRGARVCGYQARITDAVMAMRAGDKEAIKAELENLLKLAGSSSPSEPESRTCRGRTAAVVSETAMAWHVEAIGSNGQRGTMDPKTMRMAAYLYKRTLDAFSPTELASYEYPRLVKEDWPTAFKIKYAMADLLYAQKDWPKCGPAFDAVVLADPSGPESAKSAYAAALCYQSAFEQSHKGKIGHEGIGQLPGAPAGAKAAPELRPKEMTQEQTAMVHALDRYVCTIKLAQTDAAAQEQLVEVKYARARTYFEAQHWEEASLAFREIALAHPDREVGIYAAQLYLESTNVLNRHFGKTSCEDEMSADVPRFLDLYCSGHDPDSARAARNADACMSLRFVQVDLLRLGAQRLVERADRGVDALESYERAGAAYFELFRKYCQDPVAAGQKPQADRCDEIAYNAAKAFQASRLLAKAITVRQALIAFDERLHLGSMLAKKASYEIGANYQAIASYDQAASYFEKYARADVRAASADQALSDAVLLRLGLGQEQEAVKDASDFVRSYGASRPTLAGAVAFAIGAHYAEREDWEKARAAFAGVGTMSAIDRAPPDIQVQAHATLARAFSHLGTKSAATSELAKVRSLWADPAAAEAKIRNAYPSEDDGQRERRVGRAVLAVGEALFLAAEERRTTEVEPLRFPEYRGPGDRVSVKAHVDTKVKDWYLKKKAAIERVEAEYAKVLDLKPRPPPRWLIAAGSRSGLMWGDFVDDFRRAPIPRAWRGTEVEQVYTTSIDIASEPYKRDHAKPALRNCLELSTRYQYFDAFSRSCEVWLARHYKNEYHVVDELRAAPTLANNGLAEKTSPVLVSGAFFHRR